MSSRADVARNEFDTRVSKFIQDAMARTNKNHILPILQFPGAGKTTKIRDWLEKLGPTYFYMSPRHNIIEEDFVAKGTIVPHLLSRSRFVDPEHTTPFCTKARKDKRVLAMMQADVFYIGQSMCEECEHMAECDYWKTRYLIENDFVSWMGVHAHINSFLPGHLEKHPAKYDLAVIDENPYFSLFAKYDIRHPTEIINFDSIITYNELGNSEAVRNALVGLRELLRGKEVKKYWNAAAEAAKKEDMVAFRHEYFSKLPASKREINKIPRMDFVNVLTGILEKCKTPESIMRRVVLNDFEGSKVSLIDYQPEGLRAMNIPIILLDATARVPIIESIFGAGYHVDEPLNKSWRYRNVTHLNGGSEFYWKNWQKILAGYFAEPETPLALRILKKIALNSPRGVLMIGQKKIKKGVETYLTNEGITNVRFLWPYGLTSDNQYWEQCDAIVILNKPMPPNVTMEAYADLSNLSPKQINYMFVESEIMQAIGRIRQSQDKILEKPKEANGTFKMLGQDVGKIHFGEKDEVSRQDICVIILPELDGCNPFDNNDNKASYNYHRTTPYNYFKEILSFGHIDISKAYEAEMKKAFVEEVMEKTELREGYKYTSKFDQVFKYLLEKGNIEPVTGGGFRWRKSDS